MMAETPYRDYYSTRNPREFDAAIERAARDGTINDWSWHQLLGMIEPPKERETPQQWVTYCGVCGAGRRGATMQEAREAPCPQRANHPMTSH
jgi:hypothetical protein